MEPKFRREYEALQRLVDEIVSSNDDDAPGRVAMRKAIVATCQNLPMGVVYQGFADHEIVASKKRLAETS